MEDIRYMFEGGWENGGTGEWRYFRLRQEIMTLLFILDKDQKRFEPSASVNGGM